MLHDYKTCEIHNNEEAKKPVLRECCLSHGAYEHDVFINYRVKTEGATVHQVCDDLPPFLLFSLSTLPLLLSLPFLFFTLFFPLNHCSSSTLPPITPLFASTPLSLFFLSLLVFYLHTSIPSSCSFMCDLATSCGDCV